MADARAGWRASLPVVLLLIFFGVVYGTTLRSGGMFMWDEAEYASLGRSVVRGEGFVISGTPNALRPPVLPLAAAASMAITGRTDDRVVKLPNLAFSLLALFIAYWAAATAYDRATGLAAAALLGVTPTFWTATPLFLTEIPFMAFFTGAVVCFSFGVRRDPRYFYASWLCWGMALLTRYTAVLFAPIVLLFVVLAWRSRDPEVRRRVVDRHFFLAPLAGAALVGPWFLRQQLTFGNAIAGLQQASTQLQRFEPGVTTPWYFYLTHMHPMLSVGVTALAAAGVVWIVWKREPFGLHCLLGACAVIVGWLSAYRWKEERLATSIVPLLAIVAAVGLTRALTSARASLGGQAVRALILVLLFALSFRATRPVFAYRVTLGYPSFLQAMEWLRQRSSPQALVLGANYPQIFWYADRRAQDLPDKVGIADALKDSEWVVLTNFERGQKDYAQELAGKALQADVQAGNAAVFRDQQFQTVLIRSSLLLQR